MTPLVTNRKVLICIGLYPANGASTQSHLAHLALGVAMFLILVWSFVETVLFFLKFFSTDLELSLFALYQIFGLSSMLYVFIAAFLLRHKINEIFKILLNIYRACKSGLFQFLFRFESLNFFNKKVVCQN